MSIGKPKGRNATEKAVKSKAKVDLDAKVVVNHEDKNKLYTCTCCGKQYVSAKGKFNKSNSPLFAGNDGYINVCNSCRDKYYYELIKLFSGSEEKAIERMCQIFDWYYSINSLKSSKQISENRSRIGDFIRKNNLPNNAPVGSTYIDTIKEIEIENNQGISSVEEIKEKNIRVLQKTVKFFGFGFTPEQYQVLQDQYDDWVCRHECKTKAQEELFKNLCIAQLNIQIAQQTNGKISEAMKTFQDLLGSANLKPTQTNDNALADQNTFGTLIRKWEDEKPIPEPDPEWKDVDGIIKYITVYFLGHLCKMMSIKNSYSKAYEDEMERYRVQKPEYEDDDDALFDSVFHSGDNNGDE